MKNTIEAYEMVVEEMQYINRYNPYFQRWDTDFDTVISTLKGIAKEARKQADDCAYSDHDAAFRLYEVSRETYRIAKFLTELVGSES